MTTVQQIDPGGVDDRLTERVLSAVAAKTDVDPLEFDRPLFDAIDPDALEALFQRSRTVNSVEFTYLGHRIRVTGDGKVAVTDATS